MRFILLVLFIAILAWCPWFDATKAKNNIEKAVATQQSNNPKCALSIEHNTFKKSWFGYSEYVDYDCTVAEFTDIAKGKNNVLATFVGPVMNVPDPVIK